jgi:competence protein ComGF
MKAFTMIDIMTGMVVISLIIGMVFYLLTAANKQQYTYQKTRIELNEYLLMHADIQREVDKCRSISPIPYGFVLEGERRIQYTKEGGLLIRRTESSEDTLHKNIISIDFITVGESISAEPLIEQIVIKTKLQEQELNAKFFKNYGVAEPINYALLNEF